MRTPLLVLFFCMVLTALAKAQAPVQPGTTIIERRAYQPITAILGAFPPEVEIIRNLIQNSKEHIYQHIRFTEGTLNGQKVVLAQTGIGKVNAAATTTLMLEHFMPREVIFTGIAGGIHPALQPGDLVIATRVAHHDYGTITPDSLMRRNTRNPYTMQENPEYFPCDSQLVLLAQAAAQQVSFDKIKIGTDSAMPKVITGTIVTGDVFVAADKATNYLRRSLQADATEMEGAAIGQVCWQQGVPFVVIRSMSDNANNTASVDVRTFYAIAARNSAALVLGILGKL